MHSIDFKVNRLKVAVANCQISSLIDTGATISLIGIKALRKLMHKCIASMRPTNALVTVANNRTSQLAGQLNYCQST